MTTIKIDEGTFGDDGVIFQVYLVDGIMNVKRFNEEAINIGYGATPKEAIDDFIRRNKSDVLNLIFKGD